MRGVNLAPTRAVSISQSRRVVSQSIEWRVRTARVSFAASCPRRRKEAGTRREGQGSGVPRHRKQDKSSHPRFATI